MIGDFEQEAIFKERCADLFGKMYGCRVGTLTRRSVFSFDYVVHAKDCDKIIKCIYSDVPVDIEVIKGVHSAILRDNAEHIIITNGQFTQEAIDGSRNLNPSFTLIDGEACLRLFDHYAVLPQTGGYDRQTDYADNTQYRGESPGHRAEEPSVGKRLFATLASLIIPGGGCFLLFCFTKDKRYILLSVLFFVISFILFQFVSVSNAILLLAIVIYLISATVSFITLDKRINDRIKTENRSFVSSIGSVLSLLIPGAGAAVLYYLSRDRKHILYGNILLWTSFTLVFLLGRTEYDNYVVVLIVIIQLLSWVYTLRNIDDNLKQSIRGLWLVFVAVFILIIIFLTIRGFLRHSDLFKCLQLQLVELSAIVVSCL